MSMNWPPGYQQKIEQILGQPFKGGKLKSSSLFDSSDPKIIQKKIQLVKKQLAMVKKKLDFDMKQIRAKYSSERQKVSEGGVWTGILLGQKAAGRSRQIQRQ